MSTPLAPSGSAPLAAATGPASKMRLRFAKGGSLRWLSHHDLMRAFQRMLRRAGLPFRSTQGFNPHPRLVFALSLPLGVIGRAEVAELELDEPLETEVVLARLRQQCPPGLEILDARSIPPAWTARVRGLCYGLALPEDRVAGLQAKLVNLLAAQECWVERDRPAGGRPRRRLDLRPFIRDLRITAGPPWLEMDLFLTPAGTARPEEVLAVLELQDLLEAGCVLHRLRLDLEDDPHPPAAGKA